MLPITFFNEGIFDLGIDEFFQEEWQMHNCLVQIALKLDWQSLEDPWAIIDHILNLFEADLETFQLL
jgi:hypothetical protein